MIVFFYEKYEILSLPQLICRTETTLFPVFFHRDCQRKDREHLQLLRHSTLTS